MLEGISGTLSQTLWPIQHDMRHTIPQQLGGLLAELQALGVSGDIRLAELQAIHVNTNGLTAGGSSRLTELRAIHANTNGLTAAIKSIPADSIQVRVSSAGPRVFVPSSQSGPASTPNGSSGGGVDAKAVGRAVATALEGTEIKVDGRKLGRLTVRHQPLAMTELGGRR